ncbi:alpha-L-fucosidase [Motilibacter peucedani]|nr:alpha-L-fucosidase [Motilibacter peucedani]
MFADEPVRPAAYERFVRPVPRWFAEAGLGIFVHWGAYSVPAWAEPTGELGAVDPAYWFVHNPYAEWYANTIRIDASPAQLHHQQVHGGAPYDDFLDQWHAEEFDPAGMVELFRRAGASYLVPVTKHHDGIALWDAPGTGTRNTVHRGPRRDLVAAFADATRAAGMRFGVYYSGGLDWHAAPFPPLTTDDFSEHRPNDETYARYAHAHLVDLVERYRPDLLWGDIEYPDAGKPESDFSIADVFDRFYAAAPEGVVNDRRGLTHWDFRTSEYQLGTSVEGTGPWQNTRGIGLSFGYNSVEDASHHLDGPAAVKLLVDVVSRGGTLLLNVGPDAAGRVPELQRRCLEGLADWMAVNADVVNAVTPVDPSLARPSDEPWVRWTRRGDELFAVVDASEPVTLDCDPARVEGDLRVPGGLRVVRLRLR